MNERKNNQSTFFYRLKFHFIRPIYILYYPYTDAVQYSDLAD